MTPYGEDVNFWATSTSGPDTWMERTKKQVVTLNGRVLAEGFGADGEGRAAFMLTFAIGDDQFKVVWPVLPSRKGNTRAARVQAATMLFHYVQGVAIRAVVVGAKEAFFTHLMLPDGRTVGELAELSAHELLPQLSAPSE